MSTHNSSYVCIFYIFILLKNLFYNNTVKSTKEKSASNADGISFENCSFSKMKSVKPVCKLLQQFLESLIVLSPELTPVTSKE